MEPTPPSPSLAADVYWPMMKSAALIAAGKLGVFIALNQAPVSTAELAAKVGASVVGMERLCAVLVQAGYLVRTSDGRVGNSVHAQAWLAQAGQQDLNSGLRWFAHAWELMSDLSAVVVNGAPSIVLWERMKTNPALAQSFAAYMKDYAASVVKDVQRAIELPAHARTLLDVGGSHGLHAAAFCRRAPELQAVIYDLPVSLTNTPSLIASWGLSDRLRCVEGNILRDAVVGTFDVVTYFLVAHNQTDADNACVIQKLARALNPGGMLVVYEYAREAARTEVSSTAALAAAFDLTLLVETGTQTHPAERITAWLRDAGLEKIQRTDLQPIEKGSLFCAWKQ
ncbi:MAG: hypothetical protein RLZZ350_2436 [Verrucomicrobiota bacterium]|jgi:SAM-dependent methyltransferase